MKHWLILAIAVTLAVGCSSQSVRKGSNTLELLYVSKVPADSAGCSALYSTIKSFDKPLVVVDDSSFSTVSDLAWWEGQRELFLLDSLGAGLFFLPPSWMLLGPDKLKELSNRADFFIPAMNLADDSLRYILPRYMIRRQGSYRLAFSAAVRSDERAPFIRGENLLPVDSLLPVTASYLAMQSDFFFFFNEDSARKIPSGINSIPRGGNSRQLSISFRSAAEFKLIQKPLRLVQASASNPCALWQQRADSIDSELLGASSQGIGVDSLRSLALNAFGVNESVMVYLGERFVIDSLAAGGITFGMMRSALAPEIFLKVSKQDFINKANVKNIDIIAPQVKEVIIPSSMYIENMAVRGAVARTTGITSAWIARNMLAKEEN